MEAKATVFDSFTIILNSDIPTSGWDAHIKSINPSYIPNTKWDTNKTIINNFRMPNACVLPLDIFMKEAVVVVPDNCDFSTMLSSLISYLTCTIKTICPVSVANEMGFRLSIYISGTHKDNVCLTANPSITKYTQTYTKGVLDETFQGHMCRYELVFKFDDSWNLINTKKNITNEPIQVGPCFSPVTPNAPLMKEFSFASSLPQPQQTHFFGVPMQQPTQNTFGQASFGQATFGQANANVFGSSQPQNTFGPTNTFASGFGNQPQQQGFAFGSQPIPKQNFYHYR